MRLTLANVDLPESAKERVRDLIEEALRPRRVHLEATVRPAELSDGIARLPPVTPRPCGSC